MAQLAESIFRILKILLWTYLAGNLKEKFPLMASLPLENLNFRQDKSVTSISLKKKDYYIYVQVARSGFFLFFLAPANTYVVGV